MAFDSKIVLNQSENLYFNSETYTMKQCLNTETIKSFKINFIPTVLHGVIVFINCNQLICIINTCRATV